MNAAENRIRRLTLLSRRYKQAYNIQSALLRLSELASTITDMREFYPAIHNIVSEFLHAENFYIVSYDNETKQYALQYIADEHKQQDVEKKPSAEFSVGLTDYVVRTRQALLCDTVLYEQLIKDLSIPHENISFSHWMGIPVCRNGNVIGVMAVQTHSSQGYNDTDLALFSHLANHTVTAIERVKNRELLECTVKERTEQLQHINASLEKEIQERVYAERLQAALYRISELTVTSNNMESFYQAVHFVLSDLMPAENCYIALFDSRRAELNFSFSVSQHSDCFELSPASREYSHYVIRTGDARLINLSNEQQTAITVQQHNKNTPLCLSWLGAPLIIDNVVNGIIALQSYSDTYRYTEQDLDVLRFVSQHIAVAIQRRLISEQQKHHQQELERRVYDSTKELRKINLALRLQVEERKNVEQKLFYEANHDMLTGLANRQLFLQQLQQQFALQKRQLTLKLALLFIDLDRFKLINDTLGHHVGDAFLIEISKRLQTTVREHDLVARLGGDEFVVLLHNLEQDIDAEDIAERIIEKIRRPFRFQGQELNSAASIGIAYMTPDYDKAADLLRDADAAMYQAKALGRNRFIVFNELIREQILQTLSLEQQLQQALEQQKFGAVFEPVLCATDNQLLGYEATIKCDYTVSDSQVDLLDYAIQTGVLPQIERHILQQLCQHLIRQDSTGILLLRLDISHLDDQVAFTEIEKLLDNVTSPQKLCLMFSEQELLMVSDKVMRKLTVLKQRGFRLGIDCFTTDAAPMGLLMQKLMDFVKLDALFCQSLSEDYQRRQLLRLLQNLAGIYQFHIIGSGVDTVELRDLLLSDDCVFMQGSHIRNHIESLPATSSVVFKQLA